MRRLLSPITTLGLAVVFGVTLLAELAPFGWLPELFANLRLHALVVGAPILVLHLLLVGLRGPLVWGALLATALNLWACRDYVDIPGARALLAPPPEAYALERSYRIVWANLGNWSTDLPALRRWLEDEAPDVAVFTALAATHEPVLRAARSFLPHQTPLPLTSAYELQLLSRRPPQGLRFDYPLGPTYPIMEARFCNAAEPCLAVIALHAPRPGPPPAWKVDWLGDTTVRDAMIAHAAGLAATRRAAGDRVVVLGDFNATPFSPAVAALRAQARLSDSAAWRDLAGRRGWEWVAPATWRPPYGLIIDHALLGEAVALLARRDGAAIGSPHAPVGIDISLKIPPHAVPPMTR